MQEFQSFYQENLGPIYRFVYSYMRNQQEAEDPDQHDQAIETPMYNDVTIARQRQEGLLSRLEADVFDILTTT